MAVKFFLPFLNEFGNFKLFELYLTFYCQRRGTSMATEVVYFYCHHRGSTVALPADDLAEYACNEPFFSVQTPSYFDGLNELR